MELSNELARRLDILLDMDTKSIMWCSERSTASVVVVAHPGLFSIVSQVRQLRYLIIVFKHSIRNKYQSVCVSVC